MFQNNELKIFKFHTRVRQLSQYVTSTNTWFHWVEILFTFQIVENQHETDYLACRVQ